MEKHKLYHIQLKIRCSVVYYKADLGIYCPSATSDLLLGEAAAAGGGDGDVGIEGSWAVMGRWGLAGYSGA